jgi:MFS family permease
VEAGGTKTTEERPPSGARFAVASCFFLNGVLIAGWVSRIPAIQARLGASPGELGMALLALALGALVAMPSAGILISKLGSRKVSAFTVVTFSVLLPCLALAPNVWALGAILFLIGIFHGALDVAMNAQAVAVEDRYGRPIMSSFHAQWSFGGLAGAALGGLMAWVGVAPLIHFAAASIVLGGATLFFALPRLPEANEARSAVSKKSDKGRAPLRPLLALGAVGFCIMLGEGAMADWSALYLRDFTGANEGVAAAGFAAFSVAMAFARLHGDALNTRFGPEALVRLGSMLAAVGLSMSLLVPHPIVALLGFAAVGAGFATIVPQVFSAAGRTPGIEPGPAIAVTTTFGYTGFLIGPALIGFAAEWIGLRGALGIVVGTSALAVVLAPSVRRSPVGARDRVPRTVAAEALETL